LLCNDVSELSVAVQDCDGYTR